MAKVIKRKEQFAFLRKLTKNLKADKADEAAKISHELGLTELEWAELTAIHKKAKKEKQARLIKIFTEIHAGEEEVEAECEAHIDFGQDIVRIYHNGDKVGERPLTDEDRQVDMKLVSPEDAAKAKARKPKGDDDHNDVKKVIREETSRSSKKDLSTG